MLSSDAAYKSWGFWGESGDTTYEYRIESYETDSLLYYSVVCEAEDKDWLIRYDPTDPNSTLETLYGGKWLRCVLDISVDDYFRKPHYDRYLALLLSDGEAVDQSATVYSETYDAKRITPEENVSIDYLCRDGKWDAVALTLGSDGTAVFDGFTFADAPTAESRFAAYLDAPADEQQITTYIVSGSMEPALNIGKLYRFAPTDTLQVNDIVLAYSEEYQSYITHRVVAAAGGGYALRGDNSGADDNEIFTSEQILGVLVND